MVAFIGPDFETHSTLLAHGLDTTSSEFYTTQVSVSVGRQCNIVQGSPAAGVVVSGTSSGSGGSTGAAPATRTLARTPSVPDESAAEVIATHTKRLFGEGKLTGGEQNNQCVEFWMKQMLAHLEGLRKKDKDL